jgi:transposase
MKESAKRGKYTLEFKLEAVRLVRSGQSAAVVSCTLGISSKTLHGWLKLEREGKRIGTDSKPVSAEQMELARLRAENARLKMERDILKKATAYFAKESM